MKGNTTRKLGGLPNERHEFARIETSADCCNCEAIIIALGYWDHDAEYNGHHGDCVATNLDPIPPRKSVDYVVTLGLHCARCDGKKNSKPARFVQFWKQDYGRHHRRGHMPLCDVHAESEPSGPDDHIQHLYRPGESDAFDTWMEVSLYWLQRLFVSCIVE